MTVWQNVSFARQSSSVSESTSASKAWWMHGEMWFCLEGGGRNCLEGYGREKKETHTHTHTILKDFGLNGVYFFLVIHAWYQCETPQELLQLTTNHSAWLCFMSRFHSRLYDPRYNKFWNRMIKVVSYRVRWYALIISRHKSAKQNSNF